MELLTVQETAELLRVNPITVRRHIAAGRLPAVKVGRGVRVQREAIQELIVPLKPRLPQTQRLVRSSRVLTYDDPIWKLVGSATSAEPTDASRKHEYLAEALAPRKD